MVIPTETLPKAVTTNPHPQDSIIREEGARFVDPLELANLHVRLLQLVTSKATRRDDLGYRSFMRKRDPNTLIDLFQNELDHSLGDWAKLLAASPSAAIARRATMDTFSRDVVAFERFRSEWHIAAITRDAARFSESRKTHLKRVLKDAGYERLLPYVQIEVPKHPTLTQVAALLDASGGNIGIASIARWKEMATRDLKDPWRNRVKGITWQDSQAVAAIIAIRNAVAHQSPRSLQAMSDALDGLTHPSHLGLKRPINGVRLTGIPSYLHRSMGGERRVERYHRLLWDLVEGLRV